MKSLGEKFATRREELHYDEQELLAAARVRVYTACDRRAADKGAKKILHSLENRDVSPVSGMGIDSFDDQIQRLNELQEMLIQTASGEAHDYAH
ncbi:MAG: hypothetical protein NTW21_43095 [Verrucomicrobia bacterium]|nr:hypothetical protein [Verrucomicrobiota bacterium]